MPGTSLNYNRVTMNFAVYLDNDLEGWSDDCAVSNSKLIYPSQATAFYPDITVVRTTQLPCPNEETLLAADVIDESTRDFDADLRLSVYQSLPALNDYLLLRADAIDIKHYRRTSEGALDFLQSYTALSDSVPLTINGVFFFVPLDRIYRGVSFVTGARP